MGEITLWGGFCPVFLSPKCWMVNPWYPKIPMLESPCWMVVLPWISHVFLVLTELFKGWSLQWWLMKIGADQIPTHRNQRGSDPKEQRTNEDLLGYRIGGLEFIDRSWNFSKWHLLYPREDMIVSDICLTSLTLLILIARLLSYWQSPLAIGYAYVQQVWQVDQHIPRGQSCCQVELAELKVVKLVDNGSHYTRRRPVYDS